MAIMKKFLSNPKVKRAFREALKYHIDDIPGMDDGSDIYLFDELPTDLGQAGPELLTKIPLVYACLSWMRDQKRTEHIEIQRSRKTERAIIYDSCVNPMGEKPPIAKTTEKAIDAHIESQIGIQKLNRSYDETENEYQLYSSACETIRMYSDNLKAYFRTVTWDESTMRKVSKRWQPKKKEAEEELEEVEEELLEVEEVEDEGLEERPSKNIIEEKEKRKKVMERLRKPFRKISKLNTIDKDLL